MATYNIGDLVELTASFTTVSSGSASDPTTVTITVRDPTGTTSTPSVTKSSTGIYTAQVAPTDAGIWLWRAVGTGAVQAANQSEFEVAPNSF